MDTRSQAEVANDEPPKRKPALKIFISLPTVGAATIVRSIDIIFDSIEETAERYLDTLEQVSSYEVLPEMRESLISAVIANLQKEKEK